MKYKWVHQGCCQKQIRVLTNDIQNVHSAIYVEEISQMCWGIQIMQRKIKYTQYNRKQDFSN